MPVLLASIDFKELFAIFALNLLTYVLTLALLLTTFSLFNGKSLKSLSHLLRSPATPHFRFALLVALLSLSGMPPLLGFFGKFFIFVFIMTKANYTMLGVFFFFNLFALYFYLQNTRYLIHSKARKEYKVFLGRTRIADSSSLL